MEHTQPPSRPVSGRPDLKLIVNQLGLSYGAPRSGAGSAQEQDAITQDTYFSVLLGSVCNALQTQCLRHFLGNVVIKPEVRHLLSQQVMVNGKPTGLRIQKLLQQAREVQNWWSFQDEDREAVYVAMFMHGIDYWLSPCFQDGVSIKGYLREIVMPGLKDVDRNNPRAGQTLRLCMGWGNYDDESMFSEHMERRMRMAASVLELRDY